MICFEEVSTVNQMINTYKKAIIVTLSSVAVLLSSQLYAAANCKDDTLAHRIEPVGTVCVQGEECKADEVEVVEAPKGPRSGEEIVADYCAGCHASGVMNAPVIGGNFADLAARGMPALLKSGKKGKNAMPRMGGCNDCSDEELTAAIQNMIDG